MSASQKRSGGFVIYLKLCGVVDDLALRQRLLEFVDLGLGEVRIIVDNEPLQTF